MKKICIGIFAHPDDEAFGPSGYFLQQTRAGVELHLITLTLGQAGSNPDGHTDLAAVREQEWQRGGELMGATSQYDLGFEDGQLDNIALQDAAVKIDAIVDELLQAGDIDRIEFVTSDFNGITGHIDHIVAARAAALVFWRRRAHDDRFWRLRLVCLSREDAPSHNINWLYMDAGRTAAEISETVDATDLAPEIAAIMRAHRSQRGDGEMHIETRGDKLGIYHFIDTPLL